MKILFASQNQHKIEEISKILPNEYQLIGLQDIPFDGDIPETQNTIEGNAKQKALFVNDKFGFSCFADDTGLFIEALNGEPGIYSARWSQRDGHYQNNIEKALGELKTHKNRNAYFKTVIAYINNGVIHSFEGRIDGQIISTLRGDDGFGYDPIFIPNGYEQTFAEMTSIQKNKISHRGLAMKKFIDFLSRKSS